MAIPVILKGDTAREIKLVMAEGYDYDGCTLTAQLGVAIRTFSGLAPGDKVAIEYEADETATFPLGTSKLHLSLRNARGEVRTLPWAKVKVTDSPGEVYGAEITIDPGELDVADLTAADSLGVVKTKLQAVIDFLRGAGRGAALSLVVSLSLAAGAAVEPKYATINDLPGTAPVMTNAAEYAADQAATALADAKAYTDAEIAAIDIPEVDMSAVTNIAQEAATAAQERAIADAKANTAAATNALSAALTAAIPTDNVQLANGAGYVTAAITNGLQLTETDPNVPEWAKAESAPLPPNYATVSNRAMSALQSYTETDPKFSEWKNENWIEGLQAVTWASDAYYAMHLGNGFEVNYTAYDITTATNDLWTGLNILSSDVDLYVEDHRGDIERVERRIDETESSGEILAQQVAAIGAHINGEDAKVIVTNYNSSTHLPEAEFDINVSNNWLVVWREMTRWNWFLGDVFDPYTNAVAAVIANKSEREYAFFDGVTGEPAPDGFFWISQPRVAICAGAAYQRYVDTAGEVWVLESNGMVADINGTTNGYFRISDDKGNVQFEIVKGDSRTVTAAAGAMTRSSVMGVTHWHTTYMVTNAVTAPKAMFCRDIANPEWYAEDDPGCPCNVDWTHPSERIYVCEWWPQGDEPKMFMRSQYGQGSESRIVQNAPVEMQTIVIGGVKGTLGTATINGITVLTFTPGTP